MGWGQAIGAAISIATQVGGAADASGKTKRAHKADKKAAVLELLRQSYESARNRRLAVNQASIQEGAVRNAAAQTGTLNSTGVLGGLGSLQSSLGSSLSQSVANQDAAIAAYTYGATAAELRSSADTSRALSQLPSSLGFSAKGLLDKDNYSFLRRDSKYATQDLTSYSRNQIA